jgi:hypothetical protein
MSSQSPCPPHLTHSSTSDNSSQVTFRDAQLRKRYERTTAVLTDSPDEQQPVMGLLEAYQWFLQVEGEDSPRAAEAVEHLLSQDLRPALRAWYGRFGEDMNENAIRFRNRLSVLAGEKFE